MRGDKFYEKYPRKTLQPSFVSIHLNFSTQSLDLPLFSSDLGNTIQVSPNIKFNLIQIVCGHLREYYAHTDTKKESQFENEEEIQKYPLSALKASSACQDLKPLHRLIKDKFMKILHSSFKQVPCNPDFFFCAPNWGPEARLVSS